MNRILPLLLILLILLIAAPVAQAAGTPVPEGPAQAATNTTRTASPWLGVAVLVIAAGVYIYVRSLQPKDTIITNCCAPLIDEAKEARIEAARLRVELDENK